jgi:hypothetical protein
LAASVKKLILRGLYMDVKTAVKDQAQYPDIVKWFCNLGELDVEQLVLLADTTGEMSDQIYEHYRAMCDLLKSNLQRIRRICEEKDCGEVFPEDSMREQLAYVIQKAGPLGAILPEKYENLFTALKK